MTYSLNFRKKVLDTRIKERLSFAKVARRFGVSVNSIFLWSKKIGSPKHVMLKILLDRKSIRCLLSEKILIEKKNVTKVPQMSFRSY